ncbi:LXG domain-containing protein [Bacillus carboniphilus]|uniref:LXG domain-containing protein n=1 Tax=Bacillus carboniphilus TaxID=86663 RepID=A0ABY9JPQ7_9BACI|nr:LXG domain-containing protein [Bacillus carboniphilus]WLR41394.1 LXG domain-containing protein [Bacillus carboniphilus]
MKVLDSHSLHNSIDQVLSKLENQMTQLKKLESVITDFSSLDDSFSGKAGQSIRSFYRDWHVSFVSYYSYCLQDYKDLITRLSQATTSLDADPNAFIHQGFLDNDLSNGLKRAQDITFDLVDEANNHLSGINDIVYVRKLSDNQFHSHKKAADKKIDETLEDLTKFDSNQTKQFDSFIHDIQLMNQSLTELSGMMKSGKINITTYKNTDLKHSLSFFQLQKSLSEKQYFNRVLSQLTIPSEYEGMDQLLALGYLFNNQLYSNGTNKSQQSSGEGINGLEFGAEIEDGFGSDGFGNVSFNYMNDRVLNKVSFHSSGSITCQSKVFTFKKPSDPRQKKGLIASFSLFDLCLNGSFYLKAKKSFSLNNKQPLLLKQWDSISFLKIEQDSR